MLLFAILAVIVLAAVAVIALAIGVGGVGTVIVLGDAIVCAAIIIWIVKRLIKKRKK